METKEKSSLESISHLHESLLDKDIIFTVGGNGSFIKDVTDSDKNGTVRERYRINVSESNPNIEPYVALKHELFHAIFNTPVGAIEENLGKICESVPQEHRQGVAKIAKSIWNILEDQRIESLGGEIWIGDRIGLAKTKRLVGATMESADTPLEALLASRFERSDLIPEELKGVEQFIKDVEKTSVTGGLVLAKRFVDQILVPWFKKQDEPEEPPQGGDGEDEGEDGNPIDSDNPVPQGGEDGNPQPQGGDGEDGEDDNPSPQGGDGEDEGEDGNPQPQDGDGEDEGEDDNPSPQGGDGNPEDDPENHPRQGGSQTPPLTIWKKDVTYHPNDQVLHSQRKYKAVIENTNSNPITYHNPKTWELVEVDEFTDEISITGSPDNEFIQQQMDVAEVMDEQSDHGELRGNFDDEIDWDQEVNEMKENGQRDIKEMKDKLAPAGKTVSAQLLKAVNFSPREPSNEPVEENTTLTGKLVYTMKQILGSTSPKYDTEGVELDIEKAIDYRLTRQDNEIFLEDEKDTGFSVVVTVDMSGSMTGQPEKTAKTVAKSIFKAVNMIDGGKMELHGYDSSYRSDSVLSIGIATNENEIQNIGDAYGGTPTGGAIAYAREALTRMGGTHKVMFVITDGYPNEVTTIADGKNFDANKECQLQVATAIRQGMHVYGIGIGHGCELSEIFGKSWTSCNSIDTSMDTLVRGIQKEVVRYLN
jgi:Mg-chelatase subunit ChlD